ncbi:hypothetical protein DC094_13210 [Pelagibaculum spongiae]|uniref:Rhamnogalacturonase A/B/Epimerase-like pectate lyase domain-containing protein n=2 Tax=Pelagibaculum spongiae TaxID=2080658 RepID=A0A2V1H0Y7_9GAMM|nr:hypothetical protein DC094_13210 [Pelagibaculum spongiae]
MHSLLLFLIFILISAMLPIATGSATTSSISKPTIPRDRHITFTQVGNEVLIDWLPASGATEYRLIAARQLSGQQPSTLIDQTQVDEFYTLTQSHLTDGISLLLLQACNDVGCTTYQRFGGLFQSALDFYCSNMPSVTPDSKLTNCAAAEGIYPNAAGDQTQNIRNALARLAPQNRALYFPAGRYRVDSNIELQQGYNLIGDSNGLSILDGSHASTTVVIGNSNYYHKINDSEIRNLALENIRIHFYGRKNNIDISGNIFFNTKSSGYQVFVAHNQFEISSNIFLRGREFPGTVFASYRANRLNIHDNYLGDLSSAHVGQANEMLGNHAKLRLARAENLTNRDGSLLVDFQSSYSRGWYTSYSRSLNFHNNYTNSSAGRYLYNPQNQQLDIGRSEAFSHRQYDELIVTENYFSGWPAQLIAGLRFRNASKIYFAANHVDNMRLLTRVYPSSNYFGLGESYFINNYFKNSQIEFWQSFVDSATQTPSIPLFLVHDNCFDHTESVNGAYATWRSINNRQNFKISENNACLPHQPLPYGYFSEISNTEADQLIPSDFQHLLNLNVPLRD